MKRIHFLVTVELDDAAQVNAAPSYLCGEIGSFTGALVEFHTPLSERLFKPRATVEPLDGYQAAILKPDVVQGIGV